MNNRDKFKIPQRNIDLNKKIDEKYMLSKRQRITPRVNKLPQEICSQFKFCSSYKNDITDSSISGLSIIIPIRGQDRQQNLNMCISNILSYNASSIQIIVSEEDSSEKIRISNFNNDRRIIKVFTKSDKGFNKSAAVNYAVKFAEYENILMNDCDILTPIGYLSKIDEALKTHDACFFGKEIYNVNMAKFGLAWGGGKRVDYFTGGSIAFTKKAFASIGGMCEKFVGYGSEDCEFWTRISKLTNLLEQRDTTFLHLEHKRQTAFSVNAEIYNKIIETPIEERIASLKEDFSKRNGWEY